MAPRRCVQRADAVAGHGRASASAAAVTSPTRSPVNGPGPDPGHDRRQVGDADAGRGQAVPASTGPAARRAPGRRRHPLGQHRRRRRRSTVDHARGDRRGRGVDDQNQHERCQPSQAGRRSRGRARRLAVRPARPAASAQSPPSGISVSCAHLGVGLPARAATSSRASASCSTSPAPHSTTVTESATRRPDPGRRPRPASRSR